MITAAICFDGVDDEALIEAVREFLPFFTGPAPGSLVLD
jgi:hypothetical protein